MSFSYILSRPGVGAPPQGIIHVSQRGILAPTQGEWRLRLSGFSLHSGSLIPRYESVYVGRVVKPPRRLHAALSGTQIIIAPEYDTTPKKKRGTGVLGQCA